MKKKKHKRIYTYQCGLTQQTFKVGALAENPNDLVSVKAYYQLHPEFDDRPEIIKLQIQQQEALNPSAQAPVEGENEATNA